MRRRLVLYLEAMLGSVLVIPYDTGVTTEHAELIISVQKAGHPEEPMPCSLPLPLGPQIGSSSRPTPRPSPASPGVTIRSHR
jgi:hypothetical protein